jgi:hypothetical protein
MLYFVNRYSLDWYIKKLRLSLPQESSGSAIATTRKKGIIIRSGSELEQFNQLLSNPKVIELAKKTEAINPKSKEDTGSSRSSSNTDVFEI